MAFTAYVAAIVAANWMIAHVGHATGGGPHELPVGLGLQAPSGVYMAGFTFVARDIVQRSAGAWAGVAAIVVGAVLSFLVSPTLAAASGVTFLCSETCDFLVFTPLQASNFPVAVALSGALSDLVDSTLFLVLAGIPLSLAWPGQVVGKAWVVAAGGLAAAGLRRWGPLRSPGQAGAYGTVPDR